MPRKPDWIIPEWNAPPGVRALCTTRTGGASVGPYASLNLASHVNDDAEHVEQNRAILMQALNLDSQPEWLEQTHSTTVIDLDGQASRQGDAAFTTTPGKVAVVLTADCLPVLFCNRAGDQVAAAHAGWRGLLNGILEQTVNCMQSAPDQLLAWLGPAIGPARFEVGEEVREGFVQQHSHTVDYFTPTRPGHYLADLYAIARLRLSSLGLIDISGGDFCTYTDVTRFYSYRRDRETGRQASLIYINKKPS